jgi:phenylalanyl-tRNA synthetase beta subunit
MAYKLTYESLEGNLRDAQVVTIRNRIIERVAETVGGVLRE